jgi:hypothetical protein
MRHLFGYDCPESGQYERMIVLLIDDLSYLLSTLRAE